MRDLVAGSGLPRTTIHHYLREGLLPPPRKTAANAAVYGPEHLERLELLRALRGPELGPLALDEIRRVLLIVERGVAPAAAVELAALSSRALLSGEEDDGPASGRALPLKELARRSGRDLRELRALVEVGLLGDGDRGDRFDAADLAAALASGRLIDAGIAPEDLRPVASLLREAKAYEAALLDLATAGNDETAETALRESLRRAFRDLHAYLLARDPGS
jgi:DNA-binding transcriptional MerR regulator